MNIRVDHSQRCVRWGLVGAAAACIVASSLALSGCAGLVRSETTTTPPPAALTISNAGSSNNTTTGAMISWQTNLPANSQVEYGATTSYGSSTALDSTMVTTHQQGLSGLQSGTSYHFRVHSSDSSNNAAVSGDMTFSTAGDTSAPVVSII